MGKIVAIIFSLVALLCSSCSHLFSSASNADNTEQKIASADKTGSVTDKPKVKTNGPTMESYDWWRKARFGVFIHWGPGAFVHANAFRRARDKKSPKSTNASGKPVPPGFFEGAWKKYAKGGRIPQDIYDNLYRIYDPKNFDADEWVRFFKKCGVKYIVLTTKHHDGFCLWDSKYTDYDMMSTPSKIDICKELADACHKYNMPLIWYYSKWDAYEPFYDEKNPKKYSEFLYNQVEELMTKYAPIAGIWWDGGGIKFSKEDCERTFAMMKRINPGYITNGRGLGHPKNGIVFSTPEQRLGSFKMDWPWETCAVIEGSSWIWNGGHDFKSPGICLNYLINCACGDGNLLLNFGPTPDGRIVKEFRQVYERMGAYLKKYGETIYETRGGPYKPGYWGGSTRKGKKVYLHILEHWPSGELALPALPAKVVSYRALTGGSPVVGQIDKNLIVKLPAKYHDADDTIIEITLDKDAMTIAPIDTLKKRPSLTVNAKVTASSTNYHAKGAYLSNMGQPECLVAYSFESGAVNYHFGEEPQKGGKHRHIVLVPRNCRKISDAEKKKIIKAIGRHSLGDFRRWWRPAPNDKEPWVVLDIGRSVTFQSVQVVDFFGNVLGFKLQYSENGSWKTFYTGGEMNNFFLRLAKPLTAEKVRLVITKTNGHQPSITMFNLFAPEKQR